MMWMAWAYSCYIWPTCQWLSAKRFRFADMQYNLNVCNFFCKFDHRCIIWWIMDLQSYGMNFHCNNCLFLFKMKFPVPSDIPGTWKRLRCRFSPQLSARGRTTMETRSLKTSSVQPVKSGQRMLVMYDVNYCLLLSFFIYTIV